MTRYGMLCPAQIKYFLLNETARFYIDLPYKIQV